MASLKERFEKWKSRKLWQKIGDIVFWLLLILLIIPGPRKVVVTGVNRVLLVLKNPRMADEASQVKLDAADYQWNIRDEEGNVIDPDSFRGEVVFLNFWATWCPPCIAEMPEIQRIHDAYQDKVKFVLITGQRPEEVRPFLEERGYDLPVYYGGRTLPDKLSIRSIPTTFILARDGSIVNKKIGAANWDSKATRKVFDQLLDE